MNEKYKTPLKNLVASTILGSADFIDYVRENYLRDKSADDNVPATKQLMDRPSIEAIFEEVDLSKLDDRLSRDIKIYLCRQYTGEKLVQIGERFAISGSAVCHAAPRISGNFSRDRKLRERSAFRFFPVMQPIDSH